MRGRRRQGSAALAVLAVMGVVATSCSTTTTRSALPESPPEVVVTMNEYTFEHRSPVPAGRVVFRVRNEGKIDHRLTILPLPEDVPPIQEQMRGAERRVSARFAGIPTRPPGTTGMFAVDLVPGARYAMVCFVLDRDDVSHAQKGMATEFRAGG